MKNLLKKRLFWIITLCIGIFPLILPFILGLYRITIEPWTLMDFVILYSYLFWWSYLLGLALIALAAVMMILLRRQEKR